MCKNLSTFRRNPSSFVNLCFTVYIREMGLRVMIIKAVNYMFGGFKNNMDDPLVHKNSEPLTFHSFFRDTCANIYLWQVHLKFLWHLTDMCRTIRFCFIQFYALPLRVHSGILTFIHKVVLVCFFCFFFVFFNVILMYVQSSFFFNFECKTIKFVLTEESV